MSGTAQPFVISTVKKINPRRKYTAVHADATCFALRGGRSVAEVPVEFSRFFSPCSRCVTTGRWYPSDEAPPEFFSWWAAARAS